MKAMLGMHRIYYAVQYLNSQSKAWIFTAWKKISLYRKTETKQGIYSKKGLIVQAQAAWKHEIDEAEIATESASTQDIFWAVD